ncbi:zinc finger protein 2 [Scaptodrosophila lebanonensis]|uniref:Zinc finger protein 2 n=1 Tax=Drosophila lebanonensis TaxID=7225 RepID=A0A6J2UH74_DROLE|nr:zinc finger protein 2 [Scaptodrosophila lebanonensis]
MMSSKESVVLNCRTCTRACKSYKALHDEIELGPSDTTTLAGMLSFCSSLSFELDDSAGLPQHICLSCLHLLEQAFSFKRMVLDSDELLRLSLLQGQGITEEYVMFEMLNEEQERSTPTPTSTPRPTPTPTPDDVAALVETLSDPPEAEYVIETIADTSLEDGPEGLEMANLRELNAADVEFVTIKSEYDSLVEDEDEIEVMDCPESSDQILGEEIVVIHSPIEDDIIDENIDIERAEHLLTTDGENIDDEEFLDEVQPYICNICGKSFRQQCRLNQHMRVHTDEKLYSCEVCDKKLKHLRNYREHMLTHTNIKPHQCNICERFYRTTSSLAAHKRTHTEDKPHKCDTCGRGFAALDHMRRHKLTHTGERPFACDLCDKAYYDSSSLRQHKISHTGAKAFTCEICGLGLSQKSGYKKHMLVHSGEKPHKCHICGRAFTFTSNLNAHVRLHSGEKPFKCEHCSKAFPTKKRLLSHMRVHNKEAPVTVTVTPTPVGVSAPRPAVPKETYRTGQMPDVPDQQVSTSKVIVVL